MPETEPLTWRQYGDWRASKCPPPEYRAPIWMDEFDQAIHEFVGECAELAGMMTDHGAMVLLSQPTLDRVADEIGDVLFTGCWLLGYLNPNVLDQLGAIPGEIIHRRLLDLEEIVPRMHSISPQQLENLEGQPPEVVETVSQWTGSMLYSVIRMQSNAGTISNHFKKVRWQQMASPPVEEYLQFVLAALISLDVIATLINTSLESCARRNMAKLDARFPDGWKPGGGIRPQDDGAKSRIGTSEKSVDGRSPGT